MNIKVSILLITGLVLLTSCASIDKPTYDHTEITEETIKHATIKKQSQNTIEASLVNITDAETISIKSLNLANVEDEEMKKYLMEQDVIKVRFLAVDAPEITKGKNQLYGQEAKQLTEYLLSDNKVLLTLDPNATFDKFNRLLAHVSNSKGESVQLALLETGLAKIAYLFDDYMYIQDYKAAADRAKQQKLNIYSLDGYITEKGYDMGVVNKDISNMSISEIITKLEELENFKVSDIYNVIN